MRHKRKTKERRADVKWWIAAGSLCFGIIQFGITLWINGEKNSFERELQLERQYRVGLDYYYFNHEGLAELIRLVSDIGESQEPGRFSIVESLDDSRPDENGKLGGWSAFKQIHELADQEAREIHNQKYWFVSITNRGSEVIDEVHLGFEEDNSEVIVKSLKAKEVVLVSLRVSGRHADLIKVKSRMPQEAWFQFKSHGKKKTTQIDIKDVGSPRTLWNGAYLALPVW